jgi:adenylosuccinate lyase
MKIWAEGGIYLDELKSDDDIGAYLTDQELDALFDLDQHFKHVDTIFERVFG